MLSLCSLTAFFLAAGVSFGASSSASGCSSVLYTLDNNPDNASVVAMCVSENGTIVSSTTTPTGGKGLSGVVGKGQPAVGSLFSAHSVVVCGNYLFVVNPGSNTLSMFSTNPSFPTKPALVGKPVNTIGEFPVSVAYSPLLSMACVLNGGAVGGVACFSVDPVQGLTALDKSARSISKALNQTTPPVGPFSTASDLVFNPSSSALIASIKGNPLTKSPGYLYAWPVRRGRVAKKAVISQPQGVIINFSLTFLGNDFELLITDPAIGADILGVSSDLKMTVLRPVTIAYQAAICWSYYVPKLNAIFVTDTAKSNFTTVSSTNGVILDTIDYTGTGAIDTLVSRGSLYAVTQEATVLNFNIAGYGQGKVANGVQTFDPKVPNPSNVAAPLVGLGIYTPYPEPAY